MNPLSLALQGLAAPLAALAIATQGLLSGAPAVEARPPFTVIVEVDPRGAGVASGSARSAALAAARRTAAAATTPARSAALATGARTAVAADAPTRRCVLSSASRACDISELPERTASVTSASRTASVAEVPARAAEPTITRRLVALSLRGVRVSTFSIFQGDSAPSLDIALLAAGVAVNLTGASVVGELGAEGATTTSAFTLDVVAPATGGVVRHTWTVGETQALAPGAYRLRVKVIFADLSVVTYPDPSQNPIALRVVAP